MPGFAFISGYFSKKNDSKIFEKVLSKELMPLVLFQFLFEVYNLAFYHSFTGATFSLTPYWTLWYLLSLAFWRVFFQMLHKVRFILVISIILALGIGTISSVGYPLSISRTFVLFPFFLLGNFFKEKSVVEKIKNSKVLPLYCILSVIILAGAFIYVWKMKLPNGLYLNSISYKAFGFSWKKGGFFRLLNLSLAFLCIISLIILTPKWKIIFVSEIGRNSMLPYLLHGFLLKILLLHRFEFYTNLYFTFIVGFIFSMVVLFVFGKDKISFFYNKIIDKIERIVIKRT